jgi:CheY-like chemotaxis protein
LYVEDNLSNVRLVERLVARIPEVTLLVATQGRLALRMAADHRPDLILLDLHLPDISGEDVLRVLRADPRTADTPIVITSADATEARTHLLMTAGATDYLSKPFDLSRLLGLIADLDVSHRQSPLDHADSGVLADGVTPTPNASLVESIESVSPDASAMVRKLLEFVHDFRTELGVILSYCALLAEGATDTTTTSDLGTIRLATQRALDLTNRLRSLARPDTAAR